jgi:hypothetical protein
MSNLVRYAREIEAARDVVAEAQLARGRGGSIEAVNRANRKLADAHDAYRECSAGRVHDPR